MADSDWHDNEVVACINFTCNAVRGPLNGNSGEFVGVQLTLTHYDKFVGESNRTYLLTPKDVVYLYEALEHSIYLISKHLKGQ